MTAAAAPHAAGRGNGREPPGGLSLDDLLRSEPAWHRAVAAVEGGTDPVAHAAECAGRLQARGLAIDAETIVGLAVARTDRKREPAKDLLAHAHELLFAREQAAEPYPTEALGPLADAARAIAEHQQCDPAVAGQSVLGAAALLGQSRANVETLDGTRGLSLFLLTVANSGDGKDSTDRLALAMAHRWQARLAAEYRAAEAEHERARRAGEKVMPPAAPQYLLASDATVEGLRREYATGGAALGLVSTEAATVLAGYGFSAEQRIKTAAVLTSIFDRGVLSVVRATGGRTERHGVRLSAHLLVQPSAAADVLTDDTLASMGFWPRWLLSWPAEVAPRKYRPSRATEDPAVRAFWGRCDELLAAGVPQDCDGLPTLPLSAAARRVLACAFETFETAGRRGELRDVRPFALRATEIACRTAGVLAAWTGAREVSGEDAAGAVRLVEHSVSCWRSALAGRADPTAADAFSLLAWLADRRGARCKPSDILRLGPGRLRSADRRDAAVARLRDLGLVDFGDGLLFVPALAGGER